MKEVVLFLFVLTLLVGVFFVIFGLKRRSGEHIFFGIVFWGAARLAYELL